MKNKQILKQSSDTPSVVIIEDNILEIEGVCMPENALEMFKPIFESVLELDKEEVSFYFKFKYINSMSSKQILRLLFTSIELFNTIKIAWYFEKDDELMKLKGEEFKSILGIENFQFLNQF